MLSLTQKTLQLSPQYLSNRQSIFKRNRTLDNGQDLSKMANRFILQDKESLYDGMQQLKQENNQLRLSIKNLQSKHQYLRKELQSGNNETPIKNYNKIRQGYMEKIGKLEEERDSFQQKLQEAEAYIQQLQGSSQIGNVETMCMSLSEDNIKLTQILQSQEEEILQLKAQSNRLQTKYQAASTKYHQIKKLNSQLLLEIGELKKKDTLFFQRPQQVSNNKAEELLQLELDQAMVNLRNSEKKIQMVENKYLNLQQESQEHIETLEKRIIELNKKNEIQLRAFEDEKQQFQQRFHKRTILKTNQNNIEEQEQVGQQDVKIKKSVNINKTDIQIIAKKVKQTLISQKLSLQDVETYLLTNETLNIQQIMDNLQNPVFGLNDIQEINMIAIYLADIDNDTETTSSARVKSIFKTLLENYIILSDEQLDKINQMIAKKKNEMQDLLMKKYPDIYTNGKLDIYVFIYILSFKIYCEVLQQLEIQLNKYENDHLYALLTRKNKSAIILLSQVFKPFEQELEEYKKRQITEQQENELPPINVLMQDDDDEEQEQEQEQQFREQDSQQPDVNNESDNPMSPIDPAEDDQSELEIKMVNSQELKKKSQPDIQQF